MEPLECTLTLFDYLQAQEELAENPPPEFFLAAYFRAHGWWDSRAVRSPESSAQLAVAPTKEAFDAYERQFMVEDQPLAGCESQ